jgi:uncharacterized protein (TIGR00369 family)
VTHTERAAIALAEGEYAKRLGLRVTATGTGHAVVDMPFGAAIGNRGGSIHGGATASVLVAAARIAALSSERNAHARSVRVLHTNVSFLAAPLLGSGIVGSATVLQRGRDVAHVEAAAVDGAGVCVASALFAVGFESESADASKRSASEVTAVFTREESDQPRVSTSPYLAAADVRVPAGERDRAIVWMPVSPNRSADDSRRIDDGALIALADSSLAYAAHLRAAGEEIVRGVTVSLSLLFHGPADEVVEAESFVADDSDGICAANVTIRTKRDHRAVASGVGVFHLRRNGRR